MAKAVKRPRKKATNGYQMPEPLPKGEILTDVAKKQWKLGTSIGVGGFGEIYSAQAVGEKSAKYPYVIKVEPHGNGPLFVEMHFYMKNARESDVKEFMKKHKLKTFGMPVYLGSGSHEVGSAKYRFIVMEKFGTDIDKLCKEHNGLLPPSVVFQIAWQITYVLEYIHELGYVHADIKGGNVLLGAGDSNKNQAYLLDFGLATKFTTDKEFKANPKKAHDGTIEYTSRDAHHGVSTRRGDFEILGYNLIHWLGGSLRWESQLGDPKLVQQKKEDCMKDIPKFVKGCLKPCQDAVIKFLQYTDSLKFNEEPDYKKIRKLFAQELEKNGGSVNGPFELHGKKRTSAEVEADEMKANDKDSVSEKKPTKKRGKKPAENEATVPKSEEVMTEAMMEVLARKKQKEAEKKRQPRKKAERANGADLGTEDFEGYTAEMIEVKTRKVNSEKNERPPPSPRKHEEQAARPRRNVPAVNYTEKASPRHAKK